MLSICQVCLRTDKKLQTIGECLENWHDELCDFAIEITIVQFCAECANLLRKFYNYKEKCRLAACVLNMWLSQKEKDRKPLSLLSKEMPTCPLGLAKKNNCKTYFYQEADLNKTHDLNVTHDLNTTSHKIPDIDAVSVKKYNSNAPHIVIVDVTHANDFENQLIINENQPYGNKNQPHVNQNRNKNHLNINANQPYCNKNQLYTNENQSISEIQPYPSKPFIYTQTNKETVKIEKEQDTQTETLVYEELEFKNDIDDRLSEANDTNSETNQLDISRLLQEADLKSDSDSSDNEALIKKKRRKTEDGADLSWVNDLESQMKKPKTKKEKVKSVKRKKPFNIEMLKKLLLHRFASSGEVKDEDGVLIKKECIINSLDVMHIYTLNQIKNRVTASQTLTPEAIQVLSRVQKKYGDQYSSVFTVEHLPTMENAIAEFNKRQGYDSYVIAEHKCEKCYRGFKHRKMLEYHVKMYHDLALPHPCSICQMRFKNRHALLKHRNGHKAVYKCKLCPLITNYRTAMVNHYHQHKGMIYKCGLCINTFKSKSCLSAHMNYMHQSQYICSLCARTFASEIGLLQHKIRKHADDKQPSIAENAEITERTNNKTCEQCNITFVTEQIYQKHMEKSHAQKQSPYAYKKRIRVAPRQKPNFVCRVCNAIEHSFGRLTFHFNQEHPTENFELTYSALHKHLCHVCGKGYASITDLNEHKHLHTGAKPYACDQCPKSFHRKINLRNHLERHLPPTRECPTCGKKFVSAANLNNHIKMHIGVRHYTCELCAKSFLHRSALNAHVRGVHHHVRRQRKQAKPLE